MKISSVSKKVLASALSAAMVVAFAPTVAFGAGVNDRITLSYDMAGGVVTNNTQGVESGLVKVTAGPVVTVADASAYAKAGYTFKDFIVDLNGNGVLDTDEGESTVLSAGTIDVSDITAGSTVKLVAEYNVPTIAANELYSNVAAKDGQLWFDIDATSAVNANNYEIAIAKDGAAVATATFKGADIATVLGADPWLAINFGATEDKALYTNTYGYVDVKAEMGAGTYTATLTDKTKNVALSSTSIQIVDVTVDGAGCIFKKSNGQFASGLDFMAVVGQSWSSAISHAGVSLDVYKDSNTTDANKNKNADGYNLAGYKAGDVLVVDGTPAAVTGKLVKAGETALKAIYAAPGFSADLHLTGTAGSYDLAGTLANLDSSYTEYKLTVAAPDGTKLVDAAAASVGNFTVDFGSVTPALGTYTATLTGKKDGEVKNIATSQVSLVKLVFDTNGSATKATDYALNGNIYAVGDKTITKSTINGLDAPTAPTGKVFDKWTVDGAAIAYNKSNEFVMPAGTNNVVTITAAWKDEASVKAAKPSYSYANGKVVLSTAQGSDYVIKYGIAENAYNNTYSATGSGIAVNATTFADTIYAQVQGKSDASAATLQSSRVLVVSGYVASGQIAAVQGKIGNFGAMKTSDATPTAPKYWDKTLKAETDAAEAAIKAIGYASAEDWGAAVLAQAKTVVDAAAAYETAQAKAAGTLVKAADGKTYSFATASEVEKATAAVQAAVEAFVENNDGDADFVSYNAAKKEWAKADAAPTGNTAADYVAYMTAAVDAIVTTTVSAADAEAALAVTAQLKDPATAAAGLEAYAALTAAQKQLVASADVAAAQEIVAATELKDAQDDAAVSKARSASKTVKAGKNGKTTKKVSVTLKKITSASGAKVTYKKVSGKKTITVKSGKAYLAKGTKAGKYTATVQAKCGTQTAKIKVTFKVVK